MDSYVLLLPADLARDALDGTSPRIGSRKSSWREGSIAGDFKSCDLSGRGVRAGGAAHTIAPSPRRGDGRRAPCGNATSASRMVFCAALAAPHELFFGRLALQCFPAAEKIRSPRKFPLRWGFGRSR